MHHAKPQFCALRAAEQAPAHPEIGLSCFGRLGAEWAVN